MTGPQVVGIYDADGGWGGKLGYVLGVIVGGKHCSLCDITHGWNPWGRSEWKRVYARVPFKMQLIHRDRANPAQLTAAGVLPAVIAQEKGRWRRLVGPEELESCAGDPNRLMALIELDFDSK